MSKYRILITGTNGQVGQEVAKSLSLLPIDLYCATRESKSEESKFHVHLNLTKSRDIKSCIHKLQPHFIINAGAYTAVDQAEIDQEECFKVNQVALQHLASAGVEVGSFLINFSTDYVYAGEGNLPFSEEDPKLPRNIYGKSKLSGELEIEKSGIPFFNFRTSWVYGEGHNFVKSIFKKLIQSDESLNIVDDQWGAPTYAGDIGLAIHMVINQAIASPNIGTYFKQKGGHYNLCNEGYTNWHQVGLSVYHLLCEYQMIKPKNQINRVSSTGYKTRAIRPPNSRLETSKIKNKLGICMPFWKDSLEFYLKRKIEYCKLLRIFL